MSLRTPPKLRKLQRALYAKAKGEPSYRFYALYDKVYREDILAFAYRKCAANGGVPGVDGESFEDIEEYGADGQTFEDIEEYGVERWLGELAEELRSKRYRPDAVKRAYVRKQNGTKTRPLGIPTIRDRVVQMAAKEVLEAIFEPDLEPEQYGYRRRRDPLDAVRHVHRLLNTGYTEVVDADLSGYFDTIPHSELMKSVARRVSDRWMLRLIKMWLHAPVEETDERGNTHRTTRTRDEGRGVPQGAPISPLLSNLYMRRFLLGWKVLGHERRLQAHVVNYADDLVICCRGHADEAMAVMRSMMDRLKLTVNESKTRLCRVPEDSVDFLGYTIGRCWSPKTGRAYIGTVPSKTRVQRLCRTVSELTSRRSTPADVEDRVVRLNRLLTGWANHFRLGPVSKAYRNVDNHVRRRLRQWLRRKHKVQGRGVARFPDEYLHRTLGLVRLEERTRSFPWVKA